ncbi:hypothetical protein ACFL4Y_02655 [Gemmatimonadota bacterium]
MPSTLMQTGSAKPGARAIPVLLALLSGATLLSGCELLLGPGDSTSAAFSAPLWNVRTVIEGNISALDVALIPDVGPIASYVVDGTTLKISRLSDGEWENLDGPAFGPLMGTGREITTHIAVSPVGGASVLYGTATEAMVLPVDSGPGIAFALDTLPATLLPPAETQPTAFSVESSSLAYGSDGRLRVMVRDADEERLWLFRQETDGWSLGPVPFSDGISGPSQLAVYGTSNEHAVFQAGNEGYYFWWRPGKGWQERVRFVAGLPFILRLRDNQASVLTTRDRYILQVAEEQYNPQTDEYRWVLRPVKESSDLYWHNYELVLDPAGFPTHAFILGPLRNDTYEIWVTRLLSDGSWQEARVTANLTLPTFNPFDVRMVREPGGRHHMLLTTGQTSSSVGGEVQVRQRLVHLESDSPFGR